MELHDLSATRIAPYGGRDDQIRRVARVLEIIQQIAAAPGYWSRRTLAEYHEIGERMIQKDLELIRVRLRLGLEHDGGAYSFATLPHLPTLNYTLGEALALVAAVRAAQAMPGINSADLAAAVARLESIFPDELRPLLRQATEQLPTEAERGRRHVMLALLHRAWVERRRVRMEYLTSSRDGEINERTVEPYHIMPYMRAWYLVAYDHRRSAVLDFKLDRVLSARLLDETYTIPPDFDIDDYLGDNWGIMRDAGPPAEAVVLLFAPEAGRWVAEERWHKSQRAEVLPDGRVCVEFFVSVTPEMVRWLLYYGADVWVERPGWLRERLMEAHRLALAEPTVSSGGS
ncbi:MAG: WYL domain-containing protein [Candidatus Promineofilum sp.]|nr:WYL domain-containing protein [Promineifilum sp.]